MIFRRLIVRLLLLAAFACAPLLRAADSLAELRAKAEKGEAKAQFDLGLNYALGDGVPKDHAEAVKWYRKAADQGEAEAQFILGLSYLNGNDVPKDSAEAMKWFRKAAEQGHAEAEYSLGVMYDSGSAVRVAKNSAEAAK